VNLANITNLNTLINLLKKDITFKKIICNNFKKSVILYYIILYYIILYYIILYYIILYYIILYYIIYKLNEVKKMNTLVTIIKIILFIIMLPFLIVPAICIGGIILLDQNNKLNKMHVLHNKEK